VAEGLATLGGRKGTATTKGSPTTRAVLEQFGLIQHFHHVQGTDGFPSKPAPDVLFTALAAMGARPSRRSEDLRRYLWLRQARRSRAIHPELLDRRPPRADPAIGRKLSVGS